MFHGQTIETFFSVHTPTPGGSVNCNAYMSVVPSNTLGINNAGSNGGTGRTTGGHGGIIVNRLADALNLEDSTRMTSSSSRSSSRRTRHSSGVTVPPVTSSKAIVTRDDNNTIHDISIQQISPVGQEDQWSSTAL